MALGASPLLLIDEAVGLAEAKAEVARAVPVTAEALVQPLVEELVPLIYMTAAHYL